MISRMNKRGEEENTSTIVKVILILAVIGLTVLILILLLKPELLYKFSNLPDYQTSQEDKEIVVEPGQEGKTLSCPFEMGVIKDVKNKGWFGSKSKIFINGVETNLFLCNNVLGCWGKLSYASYTSVHINGFFDWKVADIGTGKLGRTITVFGNVDDAKDSAALKLIDGAYILNSNPIKICRQTLK